MNSAQHHTDETKATAGQDNDQTELDRVIMETDREYNNELPVQIIDMSEIDLNKSFDINKILPFQNNMTIDNKHSHFIKAYSEKIDLIKQFALVE